MDVFPAQVDHAGQKRILRMPNLQEAEPGGERRGGVREAFREPFLVGNGKARGHPRALQHDRTFGKSRGIGFFSRGVIGRLQREGARQPRTAGHDVEDVPGRRPMALAIVQKFRVGRPVHADAPPGQLFRHFV